MFNFYFTQKTCAISHVKKIIGATLLLTLFAAQSAYAISGACSHHGGVDYSAGADSDGSVICYDGWTGSSVLSQDMGSNHRSGYPSSTYYDSSSYSGWTMDSVILFQQKLNELNFSGLTVDGVYGSRTRQAIRAFQYKNGLVTDGIIGDKTLTALGLYRK